MKILITGGTGLIGSAFINKYQSKYKFDVLTRQKTAVQCYFQDPTNISFIHDLTSLENLDDYDGVINLAGEPIADSRWTLAQKRLICQSRWNLTKQLSKLINDSSAPPAVFISGSAIGYYGRQGHTPITEEHDSPYPEFSHRICKVWEEKALLAKDKTRVCIARTGVVLAKDKGALAKMLPAYKFGLGGRLSNGNQYMSWIHIDDMVAALDFLLQNEQCDGVFNMTAPKALTNKEFSKTLANTLKRPNLAIMPAFVLRIMFGEMADLLIFGQNIVPQRLLEQQFKFKYPQLPAALKDILSN